MKTTLFMRSAIYFWFSSALCENMGTMGILDVAERYVGDANSLSNCFILSS